MKRLGSSIGWSQALALLEEAERGSFTNVVTYSAAVSACEKAGISFCESWVMMFLSNSIPSLHKALGGSRSHFCCRDAESGARLVGGRVLYILAACWI